MLPKFPDVMLFLTLGWWDPLGVLLLPSLTLPVVHRGVEGMEKSQETARVPLEENKE